ncbi:MAG: hypothetical protein GYB68_11935 [Chloroflexi bacterium]|nr:hypothetical protein [Chloroflexota bacterium]
MLHDRSLFGEANPQTEIIGSALRVFIDQMQDPPLDRILSRHRLTDVNIQEWYPIRQVLNLIEDVYCLPNGRAMVAALGQAGARSVVGYRINGSISDLIRMYTRLLNGLYRGGSGSHLNVTMLDERRFLAAISGPLPPELWYGIIHEFIRLHGPIDSQPVIYWLPFSHGYLFNVNW